MLGLVWQLVKAALLSNVSLNANPNLIRLLGADEDLETLLKLKPEKLLLRWFNHHLKSLGVDATLDNFGAALSDSSLYMQLLEAIDPERKACVSDLGRTADLHERAKIVLRHAKRLGAEFSVQPSWALLFAEARSAIETDENDTACMLKLGEADGEEMLLSARAQRRGRGRPQRSRQL